MCWGRAEFGPYRIVAAEPLLLDPLVAELVTGVDTGNATDGHQDDQSVGQVFGTLQLAGDRRDMVVADEGQRRKAFNKLGVSPQRMIQFEEVAVVETAPDRLPQLILGGRVESGFADHRRIVAVNELPDEPRVRMLPTNVGQNRGPELLRHSVSGIQPPTVSPAAQPVRHDA